MERCKENMEHIRRIIMVSACVWTLGMGAGFAWAGGKPTGNPVLTVSGKISNKNRDTRFIFDMAMLEKLPQHSFKTRSPWYAQAREFTGPLLRDVLAVVGAEGKTLTAHALNDYKTTIPASDAAAFDVIVARLMDSKPMPVRDKGPLFIIYPFDNESELRSQTYYGRSAWQLKEINIK